MNRSGGGALLGRATGPTKLVLLTGPHRRLIAASKHPPAWQPHSMVGPPSSTTPLRWHDGRPLRCKSGVQPPRPAPWLGRHENVAGLPPIGERRPPGGAGRLGARRHQRALPCGQPARQLRRRRRGAMRAPRSPRCRAALATDGAPRRVNEASTMSSCSRDASCSSSTAAAASTSAAPGLAAALRPRSRRERAIACPGGQASQRLASSSRPERGPHSRCSAVIGVGGG